MRLPRILAGELTQRGVHPEDIGSARELRSGILEAAHGSRAAFLCPAFARVIHQNITHHARGNGEELRATLPVDGANRFDLEIKLVDQRRGLQSVLAALAPDIRAGQASKFTVNRCGEACKSLRIAIVPLLQQLRDGAERIRFGLRCHSG